MAVYFDFAPVQNRTSAGTVAEVMEGEGARHLFVTSPGASAELMNGAEPWEAAGGGFVRISGDSAVFVRFHRAGDDTAAAAGAAWRKAADQDLFLSYKAGARIRVAAA